MRGGGEGREVLSVCAGKRMGANPVTTRRWSVLHYTKESIVVPKYIVHCDVSYNIYFYEKRVTVPC